MGKMKALAVTGLKEVGIIEVDKPEVGAYEVLVNMKAAALCTVDQRTYLGVIKMPFPMVGGHETSGIVEAVGPYVTGVKPGDHVVTSFGYCNECDYCRRGYGNQCVSKTRPRFDLEGGVIIGGGMAEYVVAPASQVFKVDENLPFEKAALMEPLSCCVHSVKKARVAFGETVVIIGAGIMGLLHTMLAKLQGARVVMQEVDPARRQKALDCGADLAFNPMETDAVEYIKSITDGRGADVVFNTTALSAVWEPAIAMLGKLGRIVAYSSQHPDNPIPVKMGELHSKEIEIIGTVSPAAIDFLTATRLMSYGIIDVAPVIDSTVPFEEGAKAYEKATVPNTYRVVVTQK